jgi:hypothetical protein
VNMSFGIQLTAGYHAAGHLMISDLSLTTMSSTDSLSLNP